MKHALSAILTALGSTLAHADLSGDDLTKQFAYSALHLADWQQTRRIVANPSRWIETNPILGPKPPQSRVNQYFALTLASHWAIASALPKGEWRRAFQDGTMVLEASVIHKNYNLGVSLKW